MYQVHSVSVMTSHMAEHLINNWHIHHVTSCLAKHRQAIKKMAAWIRALRDIFHWNSDFWR